MSPVRNHFSMPFMIMQRMSAKVSVEVDQKALAPHCACLAAVQMGNRLDLFALQTDISRSAAPSFA